MWSNVVYIAFEGDDSAIQWCQLCVSLSGSLFNILQFFKEFLSESETSTMADGINYNGDLPHYVWDCLFDNLTDKSYWNVDDRNNVDLLRIITRGSNSKFQLTIGVQGSILSQISGNPDGLPRWRIW